MKKAKLTLIKQIISYEKNRLLNLPNYAIIDKKKNIIDKFRNKVTADHFLPELEKEYMQELRIVKLDEDGGLLLPR